MGKYDDYFDTKSDEAKAREQRDFKLIDVTPIAENLFVDLKREIDNMIAGNETSCNISVEKDFIDNEIRRINDIDLKEACFALNSTIEEQLNIIAKSLFERVSTKYTVSTELKKGKYIVSFVFNL